MAIVEGEKDIEDKELRSFRSLSDKSSFEIFFFFWIE